MEQRKPISKFIKNSWTNMNIRCGKYQHLQTKNKCKVYNDIKICFSREEYKQWCLIQKDHILSLNRPSVDRIDCSKDYSLDNIRIIELNENIKLKRLGNTYINGPKKSLIRGVRKTKNGKYSARITINKKEKHLGVFETEEEALNCFRNAYYKHYNFYPFEV